MPYNLVSITVSSARASNITHSGY